MFQLIKKVSVVLSLIILAGCGSSKKSSSPVVATATGYNIGANGLCYNSANQQVDMSLCAQHNNLNNNQYYYNNVGVCINRATQQPAPNNSYCVANQNTYVFNGANCINRANGAIVAPNLCNNTNYQYYTQGQVCYDRLTGTQVPFSYCSTGSYGGSCVGWYYFFAEDQYGDEYLVDTYCSGADCAGFGLYKTSTNQYQHCQ